MTHEQTPFTKPPHTKMPSWTTSVVLNAHRTKRMGTIYSYDARKNIPNKYYYQEIKELYGFKKDLDGDELPLPIIKANIIEEIEDGHFHCPRKFEEDNEDIGEDEDKEIEILEPHIIKMSMNEDIVYSVKYELSYLKNINKRIMNDTLEELKYMTDNPHTTLGKLCIRMTALDMFPEWDASDFPNIPSYD